ncbi:unnamed protein product [Arctogadus glacialis]
MATIHSALLPNLYSTMGTDHTSTACSSRRKSCLEGCEEGNAVFCSCRLFHPDGGLADSPAAGINWCDRLR